MQPRSHQALLRRAVEIAEVPALRRDLPALLAGDRDEDSYVWPLLGLRTPSIGLSHSHRPAGRRGELGRPSARTRCERLFARSREVASREPARAAALLGRACHLLGDVAVPARARGVWHYFGDPYERWVERNVERLESIAPAPLPAERDPGALVERLAVVAARHPADTTRSLGGLAKSWLGSATRVGDVEAEAQAIALLPEALAHVAALLRAWT